MAGFSYQCLTAEGHHRDGLIHAASAAEARRALEGQGWRVLALRVAGSDGGWQAAGLRDGFGAGTRDAGRSPTDGGTPAPTRAAPSPADGGRPREAARPRRPARRDAAPSRPLPQPQAAEGIPRLPARSLTLLTLQLEVMLSAGFSLVRAFHALAESDDLAIAQVGNSLCSGVEAGQPVSVAMSRIPTVFDAFYLLVVRLGEKAGTLPESFHQLTTFLRTREDRRARLASALAYPACIMVACVAMVAFLVYYMLPGYLVVFAQTGAKLPGPTKLLLDASRSVVPLVALAAILLVARRIPWSRLPGIGTVARNHAIASACRSIALLTASGISILEALQLAATSGTHLDGPLKSVREQVKNGVPLARALDGTRQFPPFVVSAVETGETTGNVADMLGRCATFLDEQVDNALDRLLKIVEPCVMLFMGIVVGFIVLAAFLPVFQVMRSL